MKLRAPVVDTSRFSAAVSWWIAFQLKHDPLTITTQQDLGSTVGRQLDHIPKADIDPTGEMESMLIALSLCFRAKYAPFLFGGRLSVCSLTDTGKAAVYGDREPF